MKKLPINTMNTWYHVGTLEEGRRGGGERNSYEGAGLSVSLVPDAWRRIARLSGDVYTLTKASPGAFLDMVYLSISARTSIFQWAVEQELLLEEEIWVYHYYDGEFDQHYEMEFPSEQEAKEEAGWDELDEEEQNWLMVRRKPQEDEIRNTLFSTTRYQASGKLLKRQHWTGECLSSQAEDFAIMVYAEDVAELDGVFWDEKLDVARLSAPRAVIFTSQINKWMYKKAISQ